MKPIYKSVVCDKPDMKAVKPKKVSASSMGKSIQAPKPNVPPMGKWIAATGPKAPTMKTIYKAKKA